MDAKMGRTVCVTGGEGFIGSHLVKMLLEKGYTVNATVRDLSYAQFLQKLPQANGEGRLSLFQADLWEDGSFDSAVEGCDAVFHVASPVDMAAKDPERVVIEGALRGTLNVLSSCQRSKSVNKIVYTSSVTAAQFPGKTLENVDETDWTSVDFLRTNKPHGWAYGISKAQAEKAALEVGEHQGIKVVSILPVIVCGSWLTPTVPVSVNVPMSVFTGNQRGFCVLKPAPAGFVHVEDLCEAHIFLMENSEAHGRYICSSTNISLPGLLKFAKERYPQYPISFSQDSVEDIMVRTSTKKLVDLGFSYKHDLSSIYDDALRQYVAEGHLKISNGTAWRTPHYPIIIDRDKLRCRP